MLKRKKQFVTTFIAFSFSFYGISAYAEGNESLTSSISATYVDTENLKYLELKDILTIPSTLGDVGEQIYDMLGLSSIKYLSSSHEKNDGSKKISGNASTDSSASTDDVLSSEEETSSNSSSKKNDKTELEDSTIAQLISLGYLDDSYSSRSESDSITEDEYISLLQRIYTDLIETQTEADTLEENTANSRSSEINTIITGETISLNAVNIDHILSAKMDSLSLNSANVSVLTLVDGGTLTLEDTTSDLVYIDLINEDETMITGDSQSSIKTLVVNHAEDLSINGSLSVDTLILTGEISSLTLDIECTVINKTDKELTYKNADGESVTVEATSDRKKSNSSSEDIEQISNHKTSSSKNGSHTSKTSVNASSKKKHSSKKSTASKSSSSAETMNSQAASSKDDAVSENEAKDETENQNMAESETEKQIEIASEVEDTVSESEQQNYDIETEEVSSDLFEKTVIAIPQIESAEYTGEVITADITENEYYTVSVNAGGTAPGIYTVILTLLDPENYKWENDAEGTQPEIELAFEIIESESDNDTAEY